MAPMRGSSSGSSPASDSARRNASTASGARSSARCAPAQDRVEGLRRRRLGGPRDVEMRKCFCGAAGFDQHHAEAQVRQYVPGGLVQLRLELTNRFVGSKDPLREERGRPKVVVRTPDLGVCLQGTTQDHPRAALYCEASR